MQNLDIFGSQILFCFQNSKKYQTRIGGFITLGIIAIIIIRLFIIWLEVYNRANPNVIQKERQVYSPEKFVFDKTNTQFAFGMQDPVQYNQFIDPQIYTVSVTQYTQTTVNDPKTGLPTSNYTQRQLKVGICNQKNFQNPSTQKKFQSIDYQNLYCIDPDEQIVLEGDYGQQSFNYAVITVSQCVSGCKSNDILDQYLKSGFFSLYYTDITVDPVIKDNPFVFFNRDLYWTTSNKSPQVLNMYFRNDYVESDFGWITSDIQTVRYPQYSTQDISSIQSSDFFFQVVIRFEKSKENLFQRKYQTISDIISQIGGFAQTLIAFGFLLCSYFSEISLNNSIINEAFNFRNQNQKKDQSNQNDTQKLNNDQLFDPNNNQQIVNQNSNKFELKNQVLFSVDKLMSDNQDSKLIQANLQQENVFQGNQTKEVDEKSNKNKKPFQLKKQYTQNQIKLSQIVQRKTKKQNNLDASNNKGNNIKQPENISKNKDNIDATKFDQEVKKMLNEETNCMQISFFEYLKLHLWPFNKEIRNKKKIIDYSVNKLYHHIDLLNVIKKLIEVDKLKRILMDDDQIKLFEYLPKPTISDQEVLNEKLQNDKQDENNFKDIFYQDTRSESQKLQDAYEAYIKISKKKSLNIIDQKIMLNIDQNLVNIFKIAQENNLQGQEENLKIFNQNSCAQNKSISDTNQMVNQTPMLQSYGEINNNQSKIEQQKRNEKLVTQKQLLGSHANSQQEIESEFQIPEDNESQNKHDLNLNPMYFSNSKAQFNNNNKK
ncbi:ABC transporter family protein (macronuclear) [Tetrahymena thermophila SB210]|uniref:ABC transporter family protein n=1 Tax=Tetrahymena thermophila (strain SB210) TaxID=312017 RepID=Q22DD5_TETTS|nr:ABC transporter family protein [Tetrahymena thermophila SB210]EAR83267.2 ABC transporter family protein [Tetrahymena thermophila SB210]|eukprot:XP_001030930.2 ABC transporter family protein [Tetrahymena thermophila SB210]